MKTSDNNYTLIFDQIDKYKVEDRRFFDNHLNEEDIIEDEAIREFCKICKEIQDNNDNVIEYFSI